MRKYGHRGSPKSSERQRKILKATRRGRWYTANDLFRLTRLPNPAEAVSALRNNGIRVEKRNVPGERYCEWRIG